ncbi:MAG: DUF4296 domain-containing protein [Flavobacteriales bacterium]
MKFLFIFLLLLSACKSTDSVPARHLDKEKMSLVLEDVLLLESHYQTKYGVPGIYKKALDQSILTVLKKHHVSSKQFRASYQYYASHPDLFKELNTKIMDRLSRQVP